MIARRLTTGFVLLAVISGMSWSVYSLLIKDDYEDPNLSASEKLTASALDAYTAITETIEPTLENILGSNTTNETQDTGNTTNEEDGSVEESQNENTESIPLNDSFFETLGNQVSEAISSTTENLSISVDEFIEEKGLSEEIKFIADVIIPKKRFSSSIPLLAKTNQVMIWDHDEQNMIGPISLSDESTLSAIGNTQMAVLFSTGLLDSQGTQLFEGDTFSLENECRVVVWDTSGYWGYSSCENPTNTSLSSLHELVSQGSILDLENGGSIFLQEN